MKRSMHRILTPAAALLALTLLAGGNPAQARDRATADQYAGLPVAELIKQRRAKMKELGEHMRAVIEFIKGAPSTPDEVKGHTTEIKALADAIPEMFPQGSGMEDGIDGAETGAKPAIWSDWPRFEEAAKLLSVEAAKLDALSVDADRSTMAQQFMLVGRDGCSGCHEDFRHKLPGTD